VLTIRDAQMAALARDRRERFVRRAVEHVRTAFPAAFAERGRAGVEASVRTALEKSDVYGLPSERDVLRYLNLMYALGFELDTDPRVPWAAEVLGNTRYDGSVKLDLLAERARRWLAARAREAR
jgi:hypothetical protein